MKNNSRIFSSEFKPRTPLEEILLELIQYLESTIACIEEKDFLNSSYSLFCRMVAINIYYISYSILLLIVNYRAIKPHDKSILWTPPKPKGSFQFEVSPFMLIPINGQVRLLYEYVTLMKAIDKIVNTQNINADEIITGIDDLSLCHMKYDCELQSLVSGKK